MPIVLLGSGNKTMENMEIVPKFIFFTFFFKILFIYSLETQREAETQRGRSGLLAGSLIWDSIPRPGSRPGPKADAQPQSHPGIP